jgi:hypothetical protein
MSSYILPIWLFQTPISLGDVRRLFVCASPQNLGGNAFFELAHCPDEMAAIRAPDYGIIVVAL